MEHGSDVVVIGGGVMGASVAYWLTQMSPGLSVTVLERDPSHAQAATALSLASIRSQFTNPVNVAISRFGIDFVRHFAGHLDLGPAGDLGLRENGYLFLTTTATGLAMLEEVAQMQRGLGAGTVILTPQEIAARFAWMEVGDLAGGSFGTRDEGWFDNMGLLAGFRTAARRQGARFVTAEAVGLTRAGARITGVVTGDGITHHADVVVNAAGTRASKVMGWAGLTLPVEPRKRTVFVIDAPGARHDAAPLVIDPAGYYIRPERGCWITATVPEDDGPCDADDFTPDLELFEDVIWPALYARAPGFDRVKVIRHWVGHYDYNTLDQNAILGPHSEVPNLFLMNGFSGHGLQQSPAVGRGVAEHILTGGWQSLNLSDLGFERVMAVRPFLERAVV